jgi:hypothetical protein
MAGYHFIRVPVLNMFAIYNIFITCVMGTLSHFAPADKLLSFAMFKEEVNQSHSSKFYIFCLMRFLFLAK